MATQKDRYLAELQQLLAAQQIASPSLGSGFNQRAPNPLGNNWESHSLGIMPNEAAQFRSGIMAGGGISPVALGLGGDESLSPEAFNQRYRLLTKTDPTDKRSGASYLIDTQDGNKLLGSRDEYNAPWNIMKDFVLPGALVWGGGALLGNALGNAGIGAGLGETAALGLDQVAALEGAGGLLGPIEGGVAQGFGELGLSGLPSLESLAGIQTLAPVSITGTSAGGGAGGLGSLGTAGSAVGGLAGAGGGGADYSNEGRNYSGPNGINPVGNSPTYPGDVPFKNINNPSLWDRLTSAAGNLSGSNWATLAGGLLGGAQGTGGDKVSTQQIIDPRMQALLYGSGPDDKNAVFGAARDFWMNNKSGMNDTMQQALNMQKAALTDPAYGQSFSNIRNVGSGLLNAPVAGNPFLSGGGGLLGGQYQAPQIPQTPQMPTAQAGGIGGLVREDDRRRALIMAGRGLLG